MKIRIVSLVLVLILLSALCLGAIPAFAQNNKIDISGLDSLAVVGSGIPGISEWDPADPAGDMTQVSPGVYTKIITVQERTPISFKFVGNDAWSEIYTFGAYEDSVYWSNGAVVSLVSGADCYSFSLAPETACNYSLTVDLTGIYPNLTVAITDEAPDYLVPDAPNPDPIKIYARVPDEWSDVRIWSWDEHCYSPDDQGPWPGDLIMSDLGGGWFCTELPGWVTGILISAHGGTLTTSDMTIEAGRDVWIIANYDPQFPIVSYDEIDIKCTHLKHSTDGLCLHCSQSVSHSYNIEYLCDCGATAERFIDVYFLKTDDFSDVYIQWSSSPSGTYDPADGVKMSLAENGIYSCRFPAEMQYAIFFDSDGTHRYADIRHISEGRNVYDAANSTWITYISAVIKTNMVAELEADDDHTGEASKTPWVIAGIVALAGVGTIVVILSVKSKK